MADLVSDRPGDGIDRAARGSIALDAGAVAADQSRVGVKALHDLAIAWLAAADRGDADALIACSHPQIAVHPTVLARGQRVYRGHDGQRAWLAHSAHAYAHHTVDVERVRLSPDGRLLIFGRLLVDEQAVGPFSLLMTVTDGLVIETHAYLSDEAMLQTLGRLD